MLGIHYIKFDSMDYVILYRNGRVRKEGRGLSFFYFLPNSSLVSVPLQSQDFQFVFHETTKDYQEVTLQGQVTYRIDCPRQLAETLDLTVNREKQYLKDDYKKIQQRLLGEARTICSIIVHRLILKEVLGQIQTIENEIFHDLQKSKTSDILGLNILNVNVSEIRPNQEVVKVLEAQTKEFLQKEVDQAWYERRNFVLEQERMIKEGELHSEIALEEHKKALIDIQMANESVEWDLEA